MKIRDGLLFSVLVSLVLGTLPALAQAAPGDLDPSFGQGGTVVSSVVWQSTAADALVRAPDGTLVVAGATPGGDFGLARFSADGALIGTFAPAGLNGADAVSLAISSSGDVLAAGWSTSMSRLIVARYSLDGQLVGGFGSGGIVSIPAPMGYTKMFANAVAVQSSGDIVVGGGAASPVEDDLVLVRLTPAGQQIGSTTLVARGITGAEINGLAIEPNDAIVAAGEANDQGLVARFDASGALDPGFGGGGVVDVASGSAASLDSVAIRPDGRIVAGGAARPHNDRHVFEAVSLLPSGALDTSFGGGVVTVAGSGDDVAYGLVIQPDGTVVLAGCGPIGGQDGMLLMRFNPDGTLDQGFGTQGQAFTALPGVAHLHAHAITLLPDGRIDAAGSADDFTVALARYEAVAPVARTDGDTNLTSTSATLDATISAYGTPTSYGFEYGTSTAFGQTTSVGSTSSTSPTAVTVAVAGLQPATTYYLRAIASNPSGSSVGDVITLTTPQADGKGGGGPGPTSKDTFAPTAAISIPTCPKALKPAACRHYRAKVATWRTLRGTVKDQAPSAGISLVQVNVVRHRPGHACYAYTAHGWRHLSCTAALARWANAHRSGSTWQIRLLRALPAGSYVMRVRAADQAGNIQTRFVAGASLRRLVLHAR